MSTNTWGRVSVVMPVFNAEDYLEETLASIFQQSYAPFEIVAIDDGSQDRSLEILRRYPEKVRIIQQENRGAAVARNLGAREARGEWLAFLDADDLWMPTKLERQLTVCGDHVWSHTDSIFLGGVNNGKRDSDMTRKYRGRVLKQLVCSNFIGTSTVMVQRVRFLQSGGFDETLRSIQDWELWTRLASQYELGYVDESLMQYRVHPASVSRNTRKTLPNHLKVIDKVFAANGPAAELQYLKATAKASSYGICTAIAEEEGDLRYAAWCAVLACCQMPLKRHYWVTALKTVLKLLMHALGVRRVS